MRICGRNSTAGVQERTPASPWRRLNIEGPNLDTELDTAVPMPQGHIQAPVAGVGCAALAVHLRAVA
jgi:hypothetical protein